MYIGLKIVDARKCGVPLSKEFWLQFDMALGILVFSTRAHLRPPLTHLADEVKKIAKVVPSVNCVVYSQEGKSYIRLLMDKEDIHKPLTESLYVVELVPEGEETATTICDSAKTLLFPPKPLKDELPKFFQSTKESQVTAKP